MTDDDFVEDLGDESFFFFFFFFFDVDDDDMSLKKLGTDVRNGNSAGGFVGVFIYIYTGRRGVHLF